MTSDQFEKAQARNEILTALDAIDTSRPVVGCLQCEGLLGLLAACREYLRAEIVAGL